MKVTKRRWLCWPHRPWQAGLGSEINLSTRLKGRKGRRAGTQTSTPTPARWLTSSLAWVALITPARRAVEASSPPGPPSRVPGALHQPCTCRRPQTLRSQTGADAGCADATQSHRAPFRTQALGEGERDVGATLPSQVFMPLISATLPPEKPSSPYDGHFLRI